MKERDKDYLGRGLWCASRGVLVWGERVDSKRLPGRIMNSSYSVGNKKTNWSHPAFACVAGSKDGGGSRRPWLCLGGSFKGNHWEGKRGRMLRCSRETSNSEKKEPALRKKKAEKQKNGGRGT